MSQIQNMVQPKLRVDYGRADQYVRPEVPKLSFGQKLGRFFAKGVSVLGPIGAAVTAVALPGIGLPIAAGLFGASRFAQDSLYRAQIRDQVRMQSVAPPQQVSMPGLFEVAPLNAGAAATDFIAPSSLEPTISDVVINRNAAHQAEIQNFQPTPL